MTGKKSTSDTQNGATKYTQFDTITIAGIGIPIIEVDNLANNNDYYGCFSPTTFEISIDKGLNPEKKYHTIVHEVVEAINYLYDTELEHHKINLLTAALVEQGFMKDQK